MTTRHRFHRRVGRYLRQNLLGLVAVFIALGGTAWALQANSVRSKHIVDGQVKSQDIAKGAVRAAQLGVIVQRGSDTVSVPAEGVADARVWCRSGERAISGSFFAFSPGVIPTGSQEEDDGRRTGWVITFYNPTSSEGNAVALVMCLKR